MIKKLNNYLLTNRPIIWNLRVIPVALLVACIQIFLYFAGRIVTDNTMDDTFNIFEISYYLIYAGAVLTAILIFIFWLVQYNRHNGLKAHYPQSNASLYVEWLLIFLLSSFIAFTPNCLSLGKSSKIKDAVDKQKWEKTMSTIDKTRALLPSSIYEFELGSKQKPLLVGNADVNRTKFDTKNFNYEQDALTPDNPIEYIGPSLLYYADNELFIHNKENIENAETVNLWLLKQEKDSIRSVMEAFLDLHKEHNQKTNMDVDYWMDLVYNPPLYPVNNDKLVSTNDNNVINHIEEKYTQLDVLNNYYKTIGSEYENTSHTKWYILISLIVGLGLSVMVFSARFTDGRSWIFALLSIGVISFAFSILLGICAIIPGVDIFSPMIYPLLWIGLFIAIGFAVTLKVVNNRKKGKSSIYINIGLWFIPALIPLGYYMYYYAREILISQTYHHSLEDMAFEMFVVSVIFSLAVMFPVVLLLRKWKALPED